MRNIYFLLIALCSTGSSMAQNSVVAGYQTSFCYAGRDLPLTAAAHNCSPERLVLTTTNGNMCKDSAGHFTWRPMHISRRETVKAYCVSGRDSVLLGSQDFRVAYLPPVMLKRCSRLSISQQDLAAAAGPATLDECSLDSRLVITSFDCRIRTDEDTAGVLLHARTADFTPAMKARFASAPAIREVEITNIWCTGTDDIRRKLARLTLNIQQPSDALPAEGTERRYFPVEVKFRGLLILPSQENIIYAGITHPIELAAAGCDRTHFRLTTDPGIMQQTRYQDLLLLPLSGDTVINITAWCIRNRDSVVIGRTTLRLREIGTACITEGEPPPYLFPREMAAMDDLADLLRRNKLYRDWEERFVMLTGFDCDVRLSSDGRIVSAGHSYRNAFTPKMKQLFSQLKPGSRIFFDNITAADREGKNRRLGSMTVIVW